ncbi:hypothetical protein STVA_10840 [Allostella vacuolata]|nr:hypothetical protein STVA_10840 [Stella vacuolata]
MIVVDASVAIKWYVSEEGSEEALALASGGQRLVAPDLLFAEVANILWRKARLGQLAEAQLRMVPRHLAMAFDQVLPCAELAGDAVDLAMRLDHPAYDCFYLALALRLNAPLVSADDRLRRRLAGTPMAAMVVGLGQEAVTPPPSSPPGAPSR